ncbi:MAG: phosphoglucomutase/phosphomannomutase family protein [Ruminococcaceae bacterium]|nr:phosphoglucomutase/phosphomannomutase family protein [Oscillospiraceae bacterium]
MKTAERQAIQFGTGGWRAVIGEDFTRENVMRVAQGICDLMREEEKTDKPVMIGYDRRFLSSSAAEWIAQVLCANGIHVWFMRRSAPTPLVMFTVKHKELHYGIEVTASHNPSEYNGVKLIVEEGRDSSVECTNRLEKLIETAEPRFMPFADAEGEGLITILKTPFNDFLDSILSRLDLNVIKRAGMRILFDPMHGSGTYPLMTVLYTARCTVDLTNSNKDAYFGGKMPAPGLRQLGDLTERVVSEGYDLGIAVDGDGDRLGIIGSNGTYISANQILVMLYYYLHEYRGWKGPVVRNLATTHMLDRVAESFGEKCHEVPVGFKYISAKLDETDAVLGGESSGGLTVRGHIYGKDSIYAASLFVEMVCSLGKPPHEIWQELEEKYGTYVMSEGNFRFALHRKSAIEHLIMVEKRLPVFNGKEIQKVGYEDGCKVYFTDGSFVICRFSGTEPLLRIFAEDSTREGADQLVEQMKLLVDLAQ